MLRHRGTLSLCSLLIAFLATRADDAQTGDTLPADKLDVEAERKILKDRGLASDAESLLQYFRDRTLSPEAQEKLAEKVRQLGSESFSQRAQAYRDLVRAGSLAKQLLIEALADPNLSTEAQRRAELCLRDISDNVELPMLIAASRLLGVMKPDGAAEALLDYCVFIADAELRQEVQQSLYRLAMPDDAPSPIFLKTLTDAKPQRRAMAGEALVRAGGIKNAALVAELVKDPVATVRLPITIALVESRDKSAVPKLIELLSQMPTDALWPAEELLTRIAGEKGPNVYLGPGQDANKVKAAWQSWWKANEAAVDLAKLDDGQKQLGLTLVSVMGTGTRGQVMEMKPNKEIVWRFEGVSYPVDAQIIGPNRVLIAEYLGNKITERDFAGKILWEKQVSLPIAAQRMPNGHTFIASRRTVTQLDDKGNTVFTYNSQNTSIAAAAQAKDGHVYLVTSTGALQKVSPQGKVVNGFQTGMVYSMGSNIEVLPGDRVLLPHYRDNKIAEYDAKGKVVWQASVPSPTSVNRLPNGNTLVVSMTQQRVVEINRQGKEVWEYKAGSRPWRARRR